MEAKDTVVRYQKKHSVVAGSHEWHMIDGYNLGAEAQAEISFKAGMKVNDTRATAAEIAGDALEEKCNELENELVLSKAEAEGYLSQLLDVQQDCLRARQLGRRDVVEWVKQNPPMPPSQHWIGWQAKLKDWGIK